MFSNNIPIAKPTQRTTIYVDNNWPLFLFVALSFNQLSETI